MLHQPEAARPECAASASTEGTDEGAASDTGCGWLLQWRARFEAEQGNAVLSRHYYARSVNVAPQDSTAWRMWAEMEAEFGFS